MKEKLIELLMSAENNAEEQGFFNCHRSKGKAECIADYLLANGVIQLPCKVGDTVYFDAVGYHDSAEIDGIHIDENGIAFSWAQYDIGVDITELWDEGEFTIEEIGKTVFLSREEAEKALKERETID